MSIYPLFLVILDPIGSKRAGGSYHPARRPWWQKGHIWARVNRIDDYVILYRYLSQAFIELTKRLIKAILADADLKYILSWLYFNGMRFVFKKWPNYILTVPVLDFVSVGLS